MVHFLIQLLILIVMFLPSIATVTVSVHLYTKYDVEGLTRAGESWQTLAERIVKLPHYQRKNLDAITQQMSAATWHTQAGWQRLLDDVRERYREALLPEVSAYFPYDKNISLPYARNTMENLGPMSFALAVLGFIWPILLILNIVPHFPGLAQYIITDSAAILGFTRVPALFVDTFTISILSVSLISLAYLLFNLMDKKALGKAVDSYKLFLDALTAALPTADNQGAVALISNSLIENKEAFARTAEVIAQRLSEFAGQELAPAIGQVFTNAVSEKLAPLINYNNTLLEDRLEQTIALQENGMRDLADAFALKMTAAVEPRLLKLAADFGALSQEIAATNDHLGVNNEEMEKLFNMEGDLLRQFNHSIAELGENQQKTVAANLDLSRSLGRVEQMMNDLFTAEEKDREERLFLLDYEKERQKEIYDRLTSGQLHMENILAEGRENVDSCRGAFLAVTAKLEGSIARMAEEAENMQGTAKANTLELLGLIGGENRELTASLSAVMNDVLAEGRQNVDSYRGAFLAVTAKLEESIARLAEEAENLQGTAKANTLELLGLIGEENRALTASLSAVMNDVLAEGRQNVDSYRGAFLAVTAKLEESIARLAEQAENMDATAKASTLELLALIGEENRALTASLSAVMDDTLTESRAGLLSSGEALQSLSEKLEAAVSQMTEQMENIGGAAKTNALEMVNLIGEENLTLTRTLIGSMEEHLNLNMENLVGGLEKAMNANLKTNERLAEVEKFLSEVIPQQYKGMSEDISSMLQRLNSAVFEAMDGAGKSIAGSIIEAGANNSEIVQKLSEQYNKLTQDYETYFTQMEDTTQKTLQEMDYQVNMIISRINDEFKGIVDQATVENKESLEQYRTITADILFTFEEQAHSISLYAKEINIDVQSLSENLNESVKQFNTELSGGVSGTLEQLDQGMAALNQRIANTVESICDAIEELPKIIGRQ